MSADEKEMERVNQLMLQTHKIENGRISFDAGVYAQWSMLLFKFLTDVRIRESEIRGKIDSMDGLVKLLEATIA